MNKSKNIVITGVSRGLGLAMTQGFIQAGHVVHGCARSAEAVAQLSRTHAAPHSFAAVDVRDAKAVEAWAAQVIARAGAPDFVLNNAALVNPNGPLWEQDVAAFSDVIDVNIKGVFHVIRAFVPAMAKRKQGVIVNFSSGWGRSTSPDVAPYCATKWAIEGLNQAFAQELPAGLATVALNPGIIDTAMLQSCFGESAHGYPAPEVWARTAVPYILKLSARNNGEALSVG